MIDWTQDLPLKRKHSTTESPLRFLRVTFGVGADKGGKVRDEGESPEVWHVGQL